MKNKEKWLHKNISIRQDSHDFYLIPCIIISNWGHWIITIAFGFWSLEIEF